MSLENGGGPSSTVIGQAGEAEVDSLASMSGADVGPVRIMYLSLWGMLIWESGREPRFLVSLADIRPSVQPKVLGAWGWS